MSSAFLRCLLVPLVAPAIGILQGRGPGSAADSAADPPAIPQGSAPAPRAAQPASAIRVYRTVCLKCHDTDGKGEIVRDVMPKVPDFTDEAWQSSRSDGELRRSILEGKGKSMPSMRSKLGSVDVGQMVGFVRAFRGGKQVVEEDEEEPAKPQREEPAKPQQTATPTPAPANGIGSPLAEPPRPSLEDRSRNEVSRTFGRSCAACHGNDGRGGEMRGNLPSIPDFTTGAWQAARSDPQLVVSVLDGKGTGMPAFRDKLSREQARALVAFIRSFGPSTMRTSPTPPDDFEVRFQKLLAEIEDLKRQYQALSGDAAPARGENGTQGPSPPPSTRQDRR